MSTSDAPLDASRLRRRIVGTVKLALAAALVGYLLQRLAGDGTFRRLIDQPKHWGLLAAAQLLVITALTINMIRWYVLVRTLGLKFTLADALRLGSVGFLMNQVSLGSIGGDVFKAVFIAREQPGSRTEAVASVIIDRVVGFYAMLLVACRGHVIVGGGFPLGGPVPKLAFVVELFTIAGTIGIGLLMTPVFTGPAVRALADRIPLAGPTLARLIDAAAAYRHERRYLFAGIAMSCVTHLLFVVAFWLIARGLPVTAPRLGEMFMISPMSMSAGALPLTPSGLGVAEAAMGELFRDFGYPESDGQLVGITFRAMTYVMAILGAVYYLSARRTVSAVLDETTDKSHVPLGGTP